MTANIARRSAAGGFARDRARGMMVLVVLAALTVILLLAATAFGSTWIPLERIVAVLTGGGERTEQLIVLQLRLPRVLLAALAGGAIAVAGFLLQKVTRNDLASPSVLGVVDGAALGIVIFLALMSNESNALVVSIAWQPAAAAAGAFTAIALVFALSGSQASSAVRLLLFGIAVAAAAKAAIMVLMLIGPIYRTTQAARWIAGAVNEANWGEVQLMALFLAPALIAVLLLTPRLPPADLDEISARSVGLNLPVFRLVIFALAGSLTAVAVAFAGGISFIVLLAPHMARLLVGRWAPGGILASLLCGAMMLIGADLTVRMLFARLHAAKSGRVLLSEIDIAHLREKDIAREIGLLAQSPSAPEDMRVEELVRLGRFPHQAMMQPWSAADAAAVEDAMFGTGVGHLRDRRLGSLSGGQLQRVWIAMVLAQETDVICLDEPVNHLDMAHQIDCLDLVSRLNRERGRTVVLVLHDLNLAARYADLLVFMKTGGIVKAGPPRDLMTEAIISSVFEIQCRVIEDPVHDRPLCIPMRTSSPRFETSA